MIDNKYYNKKKNRIGLLFLMFLLFLSKPEVFGLIYLIAYILYKIIKKNHGVEYNINKEENTNNEIEEKQQLNYRKKEYLLTKAEYNFDRVLREVVGDKYEIERQVLLSKIVEPTTKNYVDHKTGREFNPDMSKIDKKSIDFVLFTKAGYMPYVAIELDDSSHESQKSKERDLFVENVLAQVGIKLVRIKTSYNYNVTEIAELIN